MLTLFYTFKAGVPNRWPFDVAYNLLLWDGESANPDGQFPTRHPRASVW